MTRLAMPLSLLSLLHTAALFGFFYAWVYSTMWGLDVADPRVAIAAMQAMNASVRNMIFAPAFFGAPLVLFITTLVLAWTSHRTSAAWMGVATIIIIVLAVYLTMRMNVPMNEALALVQIPEDRTAAQLIWDDYSPRWQMWNQIRTATTGVAVCCIGMGLITLRAPYSAASGTRP